MSQLSIIFNPNLGRRLIRPVGMDPTRWTSSPVLCLGASIVREKTVMTTELEDGRRDGGSEIGLSHGDFDRHRDFHYCYE